MRGYGIYGVNQSDVSVAGGLIQQPLLHSKHQQSFIMENPGSQSLDDSFTSSMDETLSSGDGTPVSMDRQSSVPTNRTYTISKHSSWVESEDSELSTPRSDYSSSYQSSVATSRTYTVAKADHRAESGFEHGPLPRVPTEESLGDDDSRQDDETPTYRDTPRPPTETPEWRHKLGSTPPLMRAKAPSSNSREIIQELRKDGFIGRSTPLIPRIMRQTKSSIAFEYFFRPKGVAPRLLPRLKSDGNVGQTRAEVPRRDSPLKKSVKLYRWKSRKFCFIHLFMIAVPDK